MARTTTILIAVALVLGAASVARAHKFHASLANVEYNETTKSAEISIRVFADDLEASLGKRHGSRVQIGLTPNAEKIAFDYVASAFELRDRSGAKVDLRWVGMEPQADVVWIYVEAPLEAGLDGATVDDRIFFDLFRDQVNLVNVRHGDRKASLVFEADGAAQRIALE